MGCFGASRCHETAWDKENHGEKEKESEKRETENKLQTSRADKGGGFKRGGFPIWTCPSFFVLFCPFWDFPDFSGIFPICSGMVQGFSRFVLFLFLGLLRAPTRNSPERVRDTIRTFPEKSGKPPGLETPGLASQVTNSTTILWWQSRSNLWTDAGVDQNF